MGRRELAACSFSSSPSAASSLVSFEKPSSPARPFSSASSVARLIPSVARLIPAFRASAAWLSFSFFRRSAKHN